MHHNAEVLVCLELLSSRLWKRGVLDIRRFTFRVSLFARVYPMFNEDNRKESLPHVRRIVYYQFHIDDSE